MADDRDKFYITVRKRKGQIVSHAVSLRDAVADIDKYKKGEDEYKDEEDKTPSGDISFKSVMDDFETNMSLYMDFIPTSLTIMPMISTHLASSQLESFLHQRGSIRKELQSEELTVYELDVTAFGAYLNCERSIVSTLRGIKSIPRTMVVGLISAYDYHLSQILRVVLQTRPEIIFTSERNIRFSDLRSYKSIDDARQSILEKEIEGVVRLSHHEQFDWMEKHFSINLRSDLDAWAPFIELCERRNLFVHTGGVVSEQYINSCEKHKCLEKDHVIGVKLSVEPKYFSSSVRVVYEIGTKLVFVLWRKFAKEDREIADTAYNQVCYNLIAGQFYDLAEKLLRFGVFVLGRHTGSDSVKKMMTVNLANAVALQKRSDEANKILAEEDWSAASDQFRVCVSAVKGDLEETVRLMKKIGSGGEPSRDNYRDWPVFRSIKSEGRFAETFKEIFGEPLVSSAWIERQNKAEKQRVMPPESPEETTRH